MYRALLAAGLVAALAVPAMAQTPKGNTTKIEVQSSKQYGQYLANGQGRPLYLFTASSCSAKCEAAWPPARAASAPTAGKGVQSSMISMKGTQVAYNGHPLFYFIKDTGKTPKGESIKAFGGNWYLVSPSGEAIMKKKS